MSLAGGDGDESIDRLTHRILERGVRRVITTLGAGGARIDHGSRHDKLPPMEIEKVVSVNGAGDCFVAGFVFAESEAGADSGTEPSIEPLEYGLAAAALAVESPTAVPIA